jgi:hypothetical protein
MAFDTGAVNIMLKRIFLIGTFASIALAHVVVLYKIDTGVRASDDCLTAPQGLLVKVMQSSIRITT